MTARLSAPGVYDGVPFETYLADLAPGLSVQATTLRQLEDRCPAYAWARHYSNPKRVDDDDTEARIFGGAAHCYILEGMDVFETRYRVKPDGHDGRTKEGRAWLADNAAFEAVSYADFRAIVGIAAAIKAHPAASKAFSGGRAEVTALVQDEETGLWLKARPDYLTPRVAWNLKTTINAKRDVWERQAWALGHHISAALTIDVLAKLGRKVEYGFVVVDNKPPFTPVVRIFDDSVIEWGRIQYRAALRTFARCVETGIWPGYADEVETVGLPVWAERRLQERDERGEFTAPARKPEWNPDNMLAG